MSVPDENRQSAAVAELDGVSFLSGGFPVLEKISLKLSGGKSTVVMGNSGSGKSTLLKIAAGLIPPSAGTVRIAGKDIDRMTDRELLSIRKSRGFVFQDAALWANMTVHQNLALPLQVHRKDIPEEEVNQRIRTLSSRFNMTEELFLRPAQLSMGEQKIFSFLRALVTDPDVLFMDEPTASVDHAAAERMLQIIREFRQRGGTIVAITHDPKLTALIADCLVLIKDGRILEQGLFSDVIRTQNRAAAAILSDVLNQAAAFDTDILELLNDEGNEGLI